MLSSGALKRAMRPSRRNPPKGGKPADMPVEQPTKFEPVSSIETLSRTSKLRGRPSRTKSKSSTRVLAATSIRFLRALRESRSMRSWSVRSALANNRRVQLVTRAALMSDISQGQRSATTGRERLQHMVGTNFRKTGADQRVPPCRSYSFPDGCRIVHLPEAQLVIYPDANHGAASQQRKFFLSMPGYF